MADEQVHEDEIIATYFPAELHERMALTREIEKRISLDFDPVAEQAFVQIRNLLMNFPKTPDTTGRLFFRLDREHLTKKPPSIVMKMCRIIARTKDEAEPAWAAYKNDTESFLDYFLFTALTDIVRFRVVCNYLGDVRCLGEFLRDSPVLRGKVPHFKPDVDYTDRIDDPDLRARAQGHRAIHLSLPFPSGGREVRVEVQLMTMLQEAWDKKDHPIYEKRRVGREIPPIAQTKIRAMSDLLYIADEFFDTLWQDITRDEQPVAAGLGE